MKTKNEIIVSITRKRLLKRLAGHFGKQQQTTSVPVPQSHVYHTHGYAYTHIHMLTNDRRFTPLQRNELIKKSKRR